ncbi:hypothetical protein Tco_0978951 [Tanacetum coccineum]|uniref:Uncharacterized protein n=1 Tax=Tanacetum coccineum TaxID=301880 RepID=A0ABQ5EPP9_9ASTR
MVLGTCRVTVDAFGGVARRGGRVPPVDYVVVVAVFWGESVGVAIYAEEECRVIGARLMEALLVARDEGRNRTRIVHRVLPSGVNSGTERSAKVRTSPGGVALEVNGRGTVGGDRSVGWNVGVLGVADTSTPRHRKSGGSTNLLVCRLREGGWLKRSELTEKCCDCGIVEGAWWSGVRILSAFGSFSLFFL